MSGDPSFDTVSQSAHFFSATFVVHALHGHWWAIAACIVAAAIKEFWYDQHFESAEVRGSNLKDFSFYCLGIAAGALL